MQKTRKFPDDRAQPIKDTLTESETEGPSTLSCRVVRDRDVYLLPISVTRFFMRQSLAIASPDSENILLICEIYSPSVHHAMNFRIIIASIHYPNRIYIYMCNHYVTITRLKSSSFGFLKISLKRSL